MSGFTVNKEPLARLLAIVNKNPHPQLANETVCAHPADLHEMGVRLKNDPTYDLSTYEPMYEPFEIRSGSERTFANIVAGSLDMSNDQYMTFEVDLDLNESIVTYGSSRGRTYENGKGGNSQLRRVVTLQYMWVISIEYLKFVDTTAQVNRHNVPFSEIKRQVTV